MFRLIAAFIFIAAVCTWVRNNSATKPTYLICLSVMTVILVMCNSSFTIFVGAELALWVNKINAATLLQIAVAYNSLKYFCSNYFIADVRVRAINKMMQFILLQRLFYFIAHETRTWRSDHGCGAKWNTGMGATTGESRGPDLPKIWTPTFYIAFWWIECDYVTDCTKLGRPVHFL